MAKTEVVKDAARETGVGPDQTIAQIRELLFGEDKRSTAQRLADLDSKIEAKIDALHGEMLERLTGIENLLAQLASDTEHKRLTSIRDIGSAIAEIGSNVQKLGATRNGG